jgi:hypothetical protein
LEFFDILHRTNKPCPSLYHSDRYEYYSHFLKESAPEHVLMPTLYSLGATDIIAVRGVPIGLVGVTTDLLFVDGYEQTPYEFYVHDINHSRRMYQFSKEYAESKGLPFDDFLLETTQFVKNNLLPLITIKKSDDEHSKNIKRVMKMLLFEILHEDALPPTMDVIENALSRHPGKRTPFERLEQEKKVFYVMEPGASTLAYVFRKLAHDFYDQPEDRYDYIVAPQYRTREHIVTAAIQLSHSLNLHFENDVFLEYVSNDYGLPKDFRSQLIRDINKRLTRIFTKSFQIVY